MAEIRIINTLYGKRYAVQEPFTSTTFVTVESKDKKGKPKKEVVTKTQMLTVDYKKKEEVDSYPAIFPLTKEGLAEAKEVLKLYKK